MREIDLKLYFDAKLIAELLEEREQHLAEIEQHLAEIARLRALVEAAERRWLRPHLRGEVS